ncbi:MAG: winged helix-turn-helix domain-containing protein [Elusimicrobia bacterium]|nr:winged helix-turn-helix domain-containing protein [Elusimicrobiota bacterium]
MWTPIIGESAGKVWQVLNKKGQVEINAIKKATNLNDGSLYMALGWLAREGKVKFEQKQQKVYISLIGK